MPLLDTLLKILSRRSEPSEPIIQGGPSDDEVRRHFYNEPRFQTYGSFFQLWGGWASAGHVIGEAGSLSPPFAPGEATLWPGGLDAALMGVDLPASPPPGARAGQRVVAEGFPAGSKHVERRGGTVYLERMPGQWIVQMDDGEEPVVTGMSGGRVSTDMGETLGILITRNSPADLDADGDVDESYDMISLRAVWEAVRGSAVV